MQPPPNRGGGDLVTGERERERGLTTRGCMENEELEIDWGGESSKSGSHGEGPPCIGPSKGLRWAFVACSRGTKREHGGAAAAGGMPRHAVLEMDREPGRGERRRSLLRAS